jgi:23S rRNA pseudouridine2605 synthase
VEAHPEGERLQKILSRAGLGSRRVCEELIADGRVTVNGEIALLGRRADPEHDVVALDGVTVIVRDDLVYYLLNKPAGYVSTASDPEGRPTVVDLVPPNPRVYPVGRLDFDTEGLLLLTNDGELTQLLTHPSFGVVKTYLAEVDGDPAPATVRALREGVELDDGITAPARVKVVQRHRGSAAVEIGIHEGRNRQVRRMCDAVGHPVRRLVRTRIGPLHDRRLQPGDWRRLSAGEVRRLYEAASSDAGNSPGAENTPG